MPKDKGYKVFLWYTKDMNATTSGRSMLDAGDGFMPSRHGFGFVNSFSGYPLPFVVPRLPRFLKFSPVYGLCGGMAAAAYDCYRAGRALPALTAPPPPHSTLYRYLYRRQLDSFGVGGQYILKFAQWMALADARLEQHTAAEFGRIRARLAAGDVVLLGLVYVHWRETLVLWQNHQVLAHACTHVAPGLYNLWLYDPNYPARDDICLRVELLEKRLMCVQQIGAHETHKVRGFFAMPYTPAVPPQHW